jgi:hypothetical protein
MAAFNFPSAPALNQKYTIGNKSWTWNGIAWVTATTLNNVSGSGASISVGQLPPNNPNSGDLWWDSSSSGGGLYMYYMYFDEVEDEDVFQWIQISSSEQTIRPSDPVSPPIIEDLDGGDSGTTLFTITIDGGSASSTFSSTIDGGNSGATQTLIDSGDSSTTTFLSTIEGGSASSTFTSTIDGGAS